MLYQNPTGKLVGGILKTVGGGIMTLTGVGGLLGSGLTAALVNGLGGAMSVLGVFSAALLGGGVWLLTSGIRSVMRVGRFEKYLKALGSKTHCELNQLALHGGQVPQVRPQGIKGHD